VILFRTALDITGWVVQGTLGAPPIGSTDSIARIQVILSMLAIRGFYDESSKWIHLALELERICASGLSLSPAEKRLVISRDYVVFEELE
jgi:hypothetical protein